MTKPHESIRKYWHIVRIVLLATLVAASIAFFITLTSRYGLTTLAPKWSSDYLQYWGATRVLLVGGNPYNAETLYKMEATSGIIHELVMMWNPPWTLALALPFVILPFGLSSLAWFFVTTIVILVCGILLWHYYGLPVKYAWLGAIIVIVSFPVLQGLQLGQSHAWLLLGITGFLVAQRAKRDVMAGSALAFLSIKPHVPYLFIACVFVWILCERRWRVLLGVIITLFIMCFIVGVIAPPIFAQYLDAARNPPIYWRSATLGTWLRMVFGYEYLWLQFLPTMVGIALFVLWFIWFFRSAKVFGWVLNGSSRTYLNWDSITLWALIVSALTAPYGWSFDKIILFPIVFDYVSNWSRIPRWQLVTTVIIYIGVQIGMLAAVSDLKLWWAEPINYAFPIVVTILYIWQRSTMHAQPRIVTEVADARFSCGS